MRQQKSRAVPAGRTENTLPQSGRGLKPVLAALVAGLLLALPARAVEVLKTLAGMELQNGDTVVFVGDSIMHHWQTGCKFTQYLEDYFYTRYPKKRIHFHNAGVSADTAACALGRFDQDVAAAKPKYVTIMLGMNDGGYKAFDPAKFTAYERDMRALLDRIAAIGATAVLISPSPFDYRGVELNPKQNAASRAKLRPYNAVLGYYGAWCLEESMQRGLGWVDVYGPMNRYHAEQRRVDPKFTLIPDSIHPEATGQFVMAFLLLESQHTNRVVSQIEVSRSANGWTAAAQGGAVTECKGGADDVSFMHLAASLPWVCPPETQEGYRLTDAGHLLSNERIRVRGLAPGQYALKIDGQAVGTWSSAAWCDGIELQSNTNTPQYQQALSVALINQERNAKAVHPLRQLYERLSVAKRIQGALPKQELVDRLVKKVSEYDDKIYAANQPKPHRYEIVRLK